MSERNYLLQIAIGPVQDFIAAARRTHDLWMGSRMLSELSKAVACCVRDHVRDLGGSLIFPDAEQASSLSAGIANVILAEVTAADAKVLDCIKNEAKKAAEARLAEYGREALDKPLGKEGGKVGDLVVMERWNGQLEDIIEFYCVWTPLDGRPYDEARRTAAKLLAARKNIRDLSPSPCADRVPKSSLDGLRESVFKDGRSLSDAQRRAMSRTLRLKRNETLDAIGVIKRISDAKNFPPVSRVAVDPWVRGVFAASGKMEEADRETILEACEELKLCGVLSAVGADFYEKFPYGGEALMRGRHAGMKKDAENEGKDVTERVAEQCRKIVGVLSKLKPCDRPCEPYLAVLSADGDRMGAILDNMKDAELHRCFSKKLADFASRARDVIKGHYGVTVYTGGDDVLAFLPLDTALDCARELRSEFGSIMSSVVPSGCRPTLSIGVSIAHALEDLELLLKFARRAESDAKNGLRGEAAVGRDRNGLAVAVRARGNIAVTVREQWPAAGENDGREKSLAQLSLAERLDWWGDRFAGGEIPGKFPHELLETARFYENWDDRELLAEAVKADVTRIFVRKETDLSAENEAEIARYIGRKLGAGTGVKELADELVVGQWIAFARRYTRKPTPQKEAER